MRWSTSGILLTLAAFAAASATPARPQNASDAALTQKVQKLSQAVAQAQTQLEESQRQMIELRKQLVALQAQLAESSAKTATAQETAKKIDDLREQQELQQAEIATHDQSKVETASRYSLKLTGLLLFNGFVNVGGVDTPDTPTISEAGVGSTGASVRQTLLGLEATGPHIFGASSFADLHVDFYGNPQVSTGNYSGAYYGHPSIPRLRTAHAGLRWSDTELSIALDRTVISPDSPTSLISLASPALAWSGNLWQWNPQLEFSRTMTVGDNRFIKFQAAMIDTQDTLMPPLATSAYAQESLYTSLSEQSRWPGIEARIAVTGTPANELGNHLGVGGYFAPHLLPDGTRYNAWAASLDEQLQLPNRFELTASTYRGLALGGLGGGAYKDFTYRVDPDNAGHYYYRPLDDVGGWVQLKKRVGQRLDFNTALGIDNVFSHELTRVPVPINYSYSYLARNRTITANSIYTPTANLIFSLEFRHLTTWSTTGTPSNSNLIGLGAGYSF